MAILNCWKRRKRKKTLNGSIGGISHWLVWGMAVLFMWIIIDINSKDIIIRIVRKGKKDRVENNIAGYIKYVLIDDHDATHGNVSSYKCFSFFFVCFFVIFPMIIYFVLFNNLICCGLILVGIFCILFIFFWVLILSNINYF